MLRLIAVERSVRALLLMALGVVLMFHTHTDWGRTISRVAQHVGLDPSRQGLRRIISEASLLSPRRVFAYGAIAFAYGVLEGVEGYGLWRGRRWAEHLTVVATSLLMIPEIWELAKGATPLKVGALIVNIAIVAYLVWRLRHDRALRAAAA